MSARTGWPRRQRTAMRVGGWTFVTVGVGHAVLAHLLPSTVRRVRGVRGRAARGATPRRRVRDGFLTALVP